jgi:hypothetical protein
MGRFGCKKSWKFSFKITFYMYIYPIKTLMYVSVSGLGGVKIQCLFNLQYNYWNTYTILYNQSLFSTVHWLNSVWVALHACTECFPEFRNPKIYLPHSCRNVFCLNCLALNSSSVEQLQPLKDVSWPTVYNTQRNHSIKFTFVSLTRPSV